MKTEDTVEYNSLRWVKKELDLILQEAQASLSAYIEDTEDLSRLRESVEHLHMVQGTLQMVELYGAAQLAEEMEKVSDALLNGKIEKLEDAYDVLMRSMLQLPDYLESLQSGSKDVPMVLLPLLNDLRASRNASLLSENVLFFPDVEPEDEDSDIVINAGELSTAAKKLRPHFQIGLVGWFKGEKISASLKRILAVLGELEKKSPAAVTRRIWSISSALVEGLVENGIDANVSIKMLLGQVDRNIKQLIDVGEDEFSENIPAELLKNLLYYVARVKAETPRVKDIKETYRLKELLPADSDLEEARSGMGGLNAELLSSVSAGIREDLLEVKDALEIFVHSDVQDVTRLKYLPGLLAKIADTLSMLGLGMPREQVMEQQKVVNKILSDEHESSDEVIMNMAGVLLSVESQLNSFIANRSVAGEESAADRRLDGFSEMPESEYQEVLSAVIREGLQDFNDARQAILNYFEAPEDKSSLELVISRLDEVNGAMFMLPVQKLKHQIDGVRNYVAKVMLNAAIIPEPSAQNDLADVVTSVEYYLESLLEGRPDIELSMNSGNEAADRLNTLTDRQGVDDRVIGDEAEVVEIVEVVSNEMSDDELSVEEVESSNSEAENIVEEQADNVVEEERYIILSDDADEEILEIFIEEALEELASLSEQVPVWSKDHGNVDALATIRRSFHTLKGSGRLIGAQLIGEFAWAFESMLNRVIEKTCPLTQEVFDSLEEALAVLPQLIEQLKGNKEPIPNIYQLMDVVDAMGKPKKASSNEKPKAVLAREPEIEVEELALEPSIEETDFEGDILEISGEEIGLDTDFEVEEDSLIDIDEPSVIAADELTESLEIDMEESIEISEDEVMADLSEDELILEIEETATSDEQNDSNVLDIEELDEAISSGFDIDLTDELEALQVALSPDDEHQDEEPVAVVGSEPDEYIELEVDEVLDTEEVSLDTENDASDELQVYIDPVLFDIFKNESNSHLQKIREMLGQHHAGDVALTANADLLRALHTLYGSARTAEVNEIAELCGGLEKYVRLYLNRDSLDILDSGVELVDAVSSKVSEMLESLTNKNQQLDSDSDLLQRISNLSEALEAELQATETAALSSVDEEVESAANDFEIDDELVEIFLEEAEELLDNCENSLQRWNANNQDEESVQDLQRHLHTLKGGARMADLGPVGDLTHALESLVVAVNDGRVSFTKDMSNVLHDSLDLLSDMLSKVKAREPMTSAASLISHIDALREGKESALKAPASSSDEDDDPEPALESVLETDDDQLLSEFDSTEDTLELGLVDEAVLSDDFGFEIPEDVDESADLLGVDDAEEDSLEISIDEEAGTSSTIEDISVVKESADEDESAYSRLVLEKTANKEESASAQVKDAMANEQVRVRSDLLNELVNHASEVSVYHARMGQQVTNFSFNLSEMNQTVDRLREQLRQLSIETEAQILSRYEKETDQYDEDFDPLEMDRFSTMQQISRSLQETVGDIQSIKDLLSDDVRDSETLLLQESRVSTELQEGLMRTRMVHFGGLASRLRRIVRQTGRELNKEVELDIVGETSEVDRTVLDRIVSPLEHMLRNAVSHGIEKPEDRAAAGKQEVGHVNITVDREGGEVVIIVKDDGKGIDAKAIREKAIEKKLLDEDSKLSDRDVLQYIMQPGFSTAEKVTQISGRGVGMDVVDSEIKLLGGVLEIDTVKGMGTTFTIRLPLTLAINHALLVNVGEEIYAVPLNSIEGVVRISGPELQQFYDSGKSSYEFAGSAYNLKHLGYLLHGQQGDYSRSGQLFPVLLARAGDQSVALHVDELIGRREIVVKPVGAQISTVRGISGATILGDGRVVLILEMNALVLGDAVFHISESEAAEEANQISANVEEEREKIVMVVDDSITIRKVTERMLSRHNMKVVTAKDGIDALAQLQEIKPDVMLLDIEMPRMDGYEVATHIRNDERLKDLPIIMITSRSGAKHKDKAMAIGVDKYLGKPYQEDDLIKNIQELIG
jgi:chemosensory pili system protein ChpA (sensor histidine kinase/response regulator)